MILGDFESNLSVRDDFIFQCSVLGIKVVQRQIEWIEQVLRCWNEMIGLFVDKAEQLEDLHVEGEVLDVSREFHSADTELSDRVNKEDKLTLVLAKSKYPDFKTVVELPAVDVLYSILGQIVSDISQVQAHLSNVHKS
jgi:hypothetical protein